MIVSTAPTSCILINLGEGKEWLTSRLFILAVLLQKFRDVKVLAFTDGDVQEGHFVGWAETEKVSAALGNFYRHLAYAYNAVLKKSDAEPKRKRHSFEEMPGSPEYLLYYYLQEIRSSEAPSEPESGDWVYMEGEGAGWRVAREAAYERARWVTPTLLHRMLGSYLVTSKIQVNERDKDASVRAVLLQKESFVAAVTQDGKFEGLVERLDLVDQAIRVMLGKA